MIGIDDAAFLALAQLAAAETAAAAGGGVAGTAAGIGAGAGVGAAAETATGLGAGGLPSYIGAAGMDYGLNAAPTAAIYGNSLSGGYGAALEGLLGSGGSAPSSFAVPASTATAWDVGTMPAAAPGAGQGAAGVGQGLTSGETILASQSMPAGGGAQGAPPVGGGPTPVGPAGPEPYQPSLMERLFGPGEGPVAGTNKPPGDPTAGFSQATPSPGGVTADSPPQAAMPGPAGDVGGPKAEVPKFMGEQGKGVPMNRALQGLAMQRLMGMAGGMGGGGQQRQGMPVAAAAPPPGRMGGGMQIQYPGSSIPRVR